MANRISNPKISAPIAVAASGGTQVLLAATKHAKYIEIQERPPANYNNGTVPYAPQGLLYYLPDDGYVQAHGLNPGEILTLGDNTFERARGQFVGPMTDPSGNTIAGTALCKVVSATGTTTQVEQREYS